VSLDLLSHTALRQLSTNGHRKNPKGMQMI